MEFDLNKIDEYFPHESFREGQRECIEKILNAFQNGKTFVMAECPTGAGKSPIAMTVSKFFKKSYYLTTQKMLQSQIINDYGDGKKIVDLKGRNAYKCEYWSITKRMMDEGTLPAGQIIPKKPFRPVSCAEGVCKTRDKSSKCMVCLPKDREALCPYWFKVNRTKAARCAVMNFKSFLFQTNMTKTFDNRNLLIIDEAHNIEPQILDFVGIYLNDAMFTEFKFDKFESVAHFQDWVRKVNLLSIVSAKLKLAQLAGRTIEADDWNRMLWKLTNFMSENPDDWVIKFRELRGGVARSCELKPIFAKQYAMNYLFSKANYILMLSATILDPNVMCESLGIHKNDKYAYKMGSRFPVENRPVYFTPVGSLSYKNKEETFPKLVKAVDELVTAHSGERGIIHTHNFEIAKLLLDKCKRNVKKRFTFQRDYDTKDDMLADHAKRPDSVIIAPAMHEGLDLKEDLGRFGIVCKIPYPSFVEDPQLKARMQITPEYYDWLTSLKLVQSVGRTTRSETDKSVCYILDSDFTWFNKKCKKFLPSWFSEAVVYKT